RKAPPTFHAVVEIQNWDRVAIHGDVAETVDAILRGYRMPPEVRELTPQGEIKRLSPIEAAATSPQPEMEERVRIYPPQLSGKAPAEGAPARAQRVYPFGISRKRLEQAVRSTGANVAIVDRLEDADMVLTDRAYYR